jgi:hypothetical protein
MYLLSRMISLRRRRLHILCINPKFITFSGYDIPYHVFLLVSSTCVCFFVFYSPYTLVPAFFSTSVVSFSCVSHLQLILHARVPRLLPVSSFLGAFAYSCSAVCCSGALSALGISVI